MKLVREDTAHTDELTAAIIDILKRKASTCGPDQAAARRNLVALGEIKEEKSPVKVSNKPEFFETLMRNGSGNFRRLRSGYRAEYRYHLEPDSADEVPEMPQNFPHLLHLLSWDGGHYTIDSDFYTFTKLLDSLIYQCDEDVNRGNDILEALSTIRCALYSFIVHNAADYNNAEWII